MPGQNMIRAKGCATDKEVLPIVDKKRLAGTATDNELIVNLITCGLGTGIFTLPWSTAGASIGPAVLITGAVLALNAWTMSIIINAGERHQTFDLGALVGRLPSVGGLAEIFVNFFVWLTTYCSLVSYIIVATDSFSTTIFAGQALSRSFLVVFATCLVLPLCFLDQSRLAFTSTLAVAATALIFLNLCTALFTELGTHTQPKACYFGLSVGSVSMVSAMMQTVVIQMCVLPMYAELKDRTPAKFDRIVAISFGALFFICASFAIVGYLAFGGNVSSNVLLSLPDTHFGHLSRLLAAVEVIAVFPVVMKPMIAPFQGCEIFGRYGVHMKDAATVFVVGITLLAALKYTDLGVVNIFGGAIGCGAFVAATPSIVGLYLTENTTAAFRWTLYALAVVGISLAALGIFMTDNYAAALQNACAWPPLDRVVGQ